MRSAEHLLSLVNDVLDIARIEAGQETLVLTPIDAVLLCKEAVNMMASVAHRSGVSLTCDVDGVQCMVKGDRKRLLQVLLNLISNGVKYGGQSVEVSVRQADADTARIFVSDTGRGMSKAEQVLLFQPFQRLGAERRSSEGTGLGLALSKALVEGMDGSIGLTSGRNGTTFWITLATETPAQAEGAAWPGTEQRVRRSGSNGASRDLSVLHIEDNPMMTEFVESLCHTRDGVHLQSAMLGRIGIELAQASKPDVIFLDVHLPDIDGTEVLRLLKADPVTRGIPVVILSADATGERVEQLVKLGASKYMTKPIRAQAFFDALDEVSARGGERDLTATAPA